MSSDVSEPVIFRESGSGAVIHLDPDPARGTFRGLLPEGQYEVSAGGFRRIVTLLPGGSYTLDLRPGRRLHLHVAAQTKVDSLVSLQATVEGEGPHRLAVRTDNLEAGATATPALSQSEGAPDHRGGGKTGRRGYTLGGPVHTGGRPQPASRADRRSSGPEVSLVRAEVFASGFAALGARRRRSSGEAWTACDSCGPPRTAQWFSNSNRPSLRR